MEHNLSSGENFGDGDNDSDLESRLYANIYYLPVESEIPDEKSNTSQDSQNKTKIMDNTTILDSNKKKQESSSGCMNDQTNPKSSSNESSQRNKEVINKDMRNVTDTNLVEKVQNRDIDPYAFDETIEVQESIATMRKKSRKKKAKKIKENTKDSLDHAFKIPNKMQTLSNNCSNTEQSNISNIKTPKNKCKESKQKKQNTGKVIAKYKGSKETVKQIYSEEHKEVEEMGTKYNVLDKKGKKILQNAKDCRNKDDSNSDSSESILELPVPPKPQPLVINLNDSDEENTVISKKKTTEKTSFNVSDLYTSNFKDQVKKALSKSQAELTSLRNSEVSVRGQDIVLNCTEICKGASNINEIKETSKNALKKKDSTRELNSNVQSSAVKNNKNKSGKRNVDSKNKQLGNKSKSNINEDFVEEQSNTVGFMCSIQNIQNDITNLANTSIDFTEDVLPTDEFIMSEKKSSPNNKRKLENENDENANNVKRARKSDEFSQNEPSTSSGSKMQKNNNKSDDKNIQPMSEKLRAFYTNSRGQENFDVREVQSKMSKDPRLWTILNDDLTLKSKKHKWNLKCSYCHQNGHSRSDCTEVRKPTRCYICGLEGHKGSRCAGKICLTCGKKQDIFRQTCETCRTLYCKMCSAVGHIHTECPDLWRRYHQTTSKDQINIPSNLLGVMKPANRLSCCNCTKRGHDSSTCEDYRWSQHFPTPSFVSNYTDGPTYVDNRNEVNDIETLNQISEKSNKDIIIDVYASDDLLPFPKELLKKQISKKKAFPQHVWEEYTNVGYIIYECGYFYTIENNGMEITYKITPNKAFNTYYLMERRVIPHFLENLKNLFMFHVKIYKLHKSDNEIILRIRTFAHLINDLRRLILYWLSLDDDEKNQVMFMDLPLQRTDLINLLESKMSKLGKETGNALGLYNSINVMKDELYLTRNSNHYPSLLNRIKMAQTKLLLIINDHPNLRKVSDEIRELLEILKRLTGMDVPLQAYLQILTVYNFIFVPHTPPISFVKKYGKYSSSIANKNVKTNSLKEKIPVLQDLHIHNKMKQPFVPISNKSRGPNINNLKVCKTIEEVPPNDFIQLENSTATYSEVTYGDSIENTNRTEENIDPQNLIIYKTSECNAIPEPAMIQSGWYNDNNPFDKKMIDYNLPSTSYDLYPMDKTSDKYTNVTVNMSNKNRAGKTADNPELNMNNSTAEYQNIDKCTNIIVSVSNKDQTRTCSIENEKEQQKNNKYTNITVSVSNKDQTRNATCSSSNLNNLTNYNNQSTEAIYPENNHLNNENNLVRIEINKNAQNNQIERKSLQEDIIKPTNKGKMSNKQMKTAKMAKKKAGKGKAAKKKEVKHDIATKQLNRATKRCSNLQKLNGVIQNELNICSSNDLKHWRMFVNKIELMVRSCTILHIKKALDVLKNKKGTISRKNICTLQKMVSVELQHQKTIKNLYNGFDTAS